MITLHLVLLKNQKCCKHCGLATTYIDQIKEPYVNNKKEFKRYIDRTNYVTCTSMIKTGVKK